MTALITFHVLRPPYDMATLTPLESGALAFGSVLLCQMELSPPAIDQLTLAFPNLRRMYPEAPVLAIVRGVDGPAAAGVVYRATNLQLRGVVGAQEFTPNVLRSSLTESVNLTGELGKWVSTVVPLSWATRGILPTFLGTLAAKPVDQQRPLPDGDLLRTARDRFRGDGLPPPREWKRLLTCLRVSLRSQRYPEATLSRIAAEFEFADQAALCRAFRKGLGLTPTTARQLLGWEWLAARWLRRHL
jgi:hypothetical protein